MVFIKCLFCADAHRTASCPLYRFNFNYPQDYQKWFDKIEDLKIQLYSIRRNLTGG